MAQSNGAAGPDRGMGGLDLEALCAVARDFSVDGVINAQQEASITAPLQSPAAWRTDPAAMRQTLVALLAMNAAADAKRAALDSDLDEFDKELTELGAELAAMRADVSRAKSGSQ
jgi:hypothetical protein